MKKLLALLLILTLTSLCFLASCRGQNTPGDDDNETPGNESGSDITDITDEEGDGILNEDNIDPNGWTTVD